MLYPFSRHSCLYSIAKWSVGAALHNKWVALLKNVLNGNGKYSKACEAFFFQLFVMLMKHF